jgi:hypothetical protein
MLRAVIGVASIGGVQVLILGQVTDAESSSQGTYFHFRFGVGVVPRLDMIAFGWLTIARSIGSMSGAALSGYLAEPTGRIPAIGDFELFRRNPYFLPGVILGVISLLAAIGVMIWVPEVCTPRARSRAHDCRLTSPLPRNRMIRQRGPQSRYHIDLS